MNLNDHPMDGIIVSTEMDIDPSITLEPSVLGATRSISPADQTTNGMTSKIPNGGSLSLRQELPAPMPTKPKLPQLPYATSQTGLVYDVRMRFHVEVMSEANQGMHPEDPQIEEEDRCLFNPC